MNLKYSMQSIPAGVAHIWHPFRMRFCLFAISPDVVVTLRVPPQSGANFLQSLRDFYNSRFRLLNLNLLGIHFRNVGYILKSKMSCKRCVRTLVNYIFDLFTSKPPYLFSEGYFFCSACGPSPYVSLNTL